MSDSVNELQAIVADPENRAKLIEVFSIQALLENCIIDRNYRLSDNLIRPLRFTPLGKQTIDA